MEKGVVAGLIQQVVPCFFLVGPSYLSRKVSFAEFRRGKERGRGLLICEQTDPEYSRFVSKPDKVPWSKVRRVSSRVEKKLCYHINFQLPSSVDVGLNGTH